MKFEDKDCNINIICEEVWYNVYADLSYGEYPEYPESDEDWFKLFKDYLNYSLDIEISEKEMLDNRDVIIQYGKKYIKNEDSNNYEGAVNMILESVADFEFDDVYICDPKLREKAKKEAITKLYNEYCK